MTVGGSELSLWTAEFRAGSVLHVVSAVAWGAVIAALVALGRCYRGTPGEARGRRVVAWLLAVFVVVYNAYYLWPRNFDIKVSLPIQMCDIALAVTPVALGLQARWARVILYFWGLLFSVQGFFFPTLQSGPAVVRFWCFWISHAAIVGVALYDLIVLGFRPTIRDLMMAWGASLVYASCVTAINIPFKLNYGFIGDDLPNNPTPLHALGPWPLRAVWIVLIGLALQGVAWAVWPLARRVKARFEAP